MATVVDRRSLGMKHMAAAVAVLVGGLVVVLLLMGQLGVGNSTDDAAAPAADAIGGLERASRPRPARRGADRSAVELAGELVPGQRAAPGGRRSDGGPGRLADRGTAGSSRWCSPRRSPGDLVAAEIVTPGSADRGTATAGGTGSGQV